MLQHRERYVARFWTVKPHGREHIAAKEKAGFPPAEVSRINNNCDGRSPGIANSSPRSSRARSAGGFHKAPTREGGRCRHPARQSGLFLARKSHSARSTPLYSPRPSVGPTSCFPRKSLQRSGHLPAVTAGRDAGGFRDGVAASRSPTRSDETNNLVRRRPRHYFPGKRHSGLWHELARSGMSQFGVFSCGMARGRNRAIGRCVYRLESTQWPSLEQ
jgi:hypothetical protein